MLVQVKSIGKTIIFFSKKALRPWLRLVSYVINMVVLVSYLVNMVVQVINLRHNPFRSGNCHPIYSYLENQASPTAACDASVCDSHHS